MQDDAALTLYRRSLSGGMNNRNDGTNISEEQATVLENVDIGVRGQTRKRPGIDEVGEVGSSAGSSVFGFEPANATNELITVHGGTLSGWTGTGSFTAHKSDFVAGTPVKLLKVGEQGQDDVLLVYIQGNNWFRMLRDHTFQDLGNTSGTASDSPPLSGVATFFRNRLWVFKDNLLSYSDAFPSDYSTAFNTAEAYRIPAGEERAVIAIRDLGLIVLGQDSIWGINPSQIPDINDKVEKLIDYGCVANDTAVQVGDDVLFLSNDGVRGLFRTQQDKVQTGNSRPISYNLRKEYDSISWGYISQASAIYYDNKYFLSLPVDASTYNNEVWVYYPASNAWVVITGWNVSAWSKMRINGEEKLFATDSTNGKVYEAWTGFSDNGLPIKYKEEGRKEDLGQPFVTKTGGELKIRALSSGNYDIPIEISIDDKEFDLVGTMNLAGNAPTLPVALPVQLAANNIVTATTHLDRFGPWRTIVVRIKHEDLNGSDDIVFLERSIITYADAYQSE
jgi:hypothetical protein